MPEDHDDGSEEGELMDDQENRRTEASALPPRKDDTMASLNNNASSSPAVARKRSRLSGNLDVLGGGAGVYLPPAKRRQLEKLALEEQQKQQQNDGDDAAKEQQDSVDEEQQRRQSAVLQRKTWEEQKRVVHGTINRLNAGTIKPLVHDLFDKVNLIRLRGVLAKSLLQAAVTSPRFSNVYAALISVINSKLPEVGELVVHRAILAFRRHYRRREKQSCLATAIFLAHLFHQQMVHELLLLQILSLLLDGDPTDDSVEIAVQLLTVSGNALLEVTPAGVRAVLERLRALLHEGRLNKRVEYKMEQLLALRKTGFRDNPPIPEELDLIESDDQITFEMSLDDEDIKKEEGLDVFRVDPDYAATEQEWKDIRAEILGLGDGDDDDDEDSGDSETDSGSDDDEEASDDDHAPDQELPVVPNASSTTLAVRDLSEADLVHLRRSIYLTIMSSATFEECTHKLAKIDIPEGREEELINMLIECCSQERTFLRYYGLISARFCLINERWRNAFMEAFATQYNTIHRLETNKLRNVAKLFAHLLHTDSVPWGVLAVIHLNEDETTSSSRIFVKILIQEMAEALGIAKLKTRFETEDPEQQEWYMGMFPRDNMRSTRYAINFFTSIGLGPLTDGLREFLKKAPKLIMAQAEQNALVKKDDDDSSVSSSSTESSALSTSSSSSDSSSSSSSSSSRGRRRKRGGRRRRGRSRSSSSSDSSRSDSSSSSESSAGDRRRSNRTKRRKDRSPSFSSRSSRGRSSSSDRSLSRSGSRSPSPPSNKQQWKRRDKSRSRSPESNRDGGKNKEGGEKSKQRKNRVSHSRSGSRSRSRSR